MTYHPVFPINGIWHVELTNPDGTKQYVKFDDYHPAFTFYRHPEEKAA